MTYLHLCASPVRRSLSRRGPCPGRPARAVPTSPGRRGPRVCASARLPSRPGGCPWAFRGSARHGRGPCPGHRAAEDRPVSNCRLLQYKSLFSSTSTSLSRKSLQFKRPEISTNVCCRFTCVLGKKDHKTALRNEEIYVSLCQPFSAQRSPFQSE